MESPIEHAPSLDVIAEIASHVDDQTVHAMSCVSQSTRMATSVEKLRRELNQARQRIQELEQFKQRFTKGRITKVIFCLDCGNVTFLERWQDTVHCLENKGWQRCEHGTCDKLICPHCVRIRIANQQQFFCDECS